MDRMLQKRRPHRHPPSGVAPLGSSVRPPVWRVLLDYAGLNSVPCRSMACMMMAIGGCRRHLGLVDDRAVSGHDANMRLGHRDIQASEILHGVGLLFFQ